MAIVVDAECDKKVYTSAPSRLGEWKRNLVGEIRQQAIRVEGGSQSKQPARAKRARALI